MNSFLTFPPRHPVEQILDLRPARLSGDPGPLPARCQWLAGDGPFREADKCGAPTAAGAVYCRRHQALARAAPRNRDGPPNGGGGP